MWSAIRPSLARNASVLFFAFVYYIPIANGVIGDGSVGVVLLFVLVFVVVVVVEGLVMLVVLVNIKSTTNQQNQ